MPTQPTGLIIDLALQRIEFVLERILDLGTTARHAARAEADAHFAHRHALLFGARLARDAVGFVFEEVGNHVRDGVGLHVAVGGLVDLHGGREGAATKARHLLHGEESVGIGVALLDSKIVQHRFIDRLGTLHMAGRAIADTDHMPADGRPPKLREERRHALDLRRGDRRDFAHAPQRLFRQMLERLLHRLQDRNHRGRVGSDLGNDPVHFQNVYFAIHLFV